MPTLVEFFDGARRASQSDQALAVLYYLKHYEGIPVATATEVRDGLRRARVAKAQAINVSRALSSAGSKVDRVDGRWEITGTGETYIREAMALPDDRPQAQYDAHSLEKLAAGIRDEAIRGYIQESIKCLKVGAFRAAIVFLWTGAVAALRDDLWEGTKARDIEAALQVHRANAKFRKKGDFAYVKDSELLQAAFDLSLLDKTEKDTLGQNLTLRNGCGHPTKYNPGENKTSGFIEDVVGIVFR
jgi:hypothetical protein